MNRDTGWSPSPAHGRAVLSACALSVVAVLARRPDLIVLATPFIMAAAWGASTRPTQPPVCRQRIGHGTIREGESTTWHVTLDGAAGIIDDAAIVLDAPAHCELSPASGQVAIGRVGDRIAPMSVAVRATKWGHVRVGPALIVASSPLGGYRWTSRHGEDGARLTVLPQSHRFASVSSSVRTPGLVGVNRSVRPGDGSEFATIRPFQPGDRLRRINWRQSLASGQMHVAATWADHDRHVVVLIDAITEVGPSDGIDGRASSLDIAVRAGGAIAEHHIQQGDRVALTVMGARQSVGLRPRTGHRHLRRVLEVMAAIKPVLGVIDDGRVPPGLGGGALVVMLSPLTAPRALDRAVTLTRRGLPVVVIDTLPADIADQDDPLERLAWRIRLLERDRTIREARLHGVPVVAWRGPGTLDEVIRHVQQRRHVTGSGATRWS